jgi:hypothetical protein
MDKQLSFAEIKKIYKKIKVLATDGKKYSLTDYFPIYLSIKDEPNLIYLDTGGQMDRCDFFSAKIIGNDLIRQLDNGEWRKISTLILPKGGEKNG